MNVASYLYQSPSSSAVQVGRLDPSSNKEEKSTASSRASLDTSAPVQKEAQSFAATQQKSKVSPTVNSKHSLDVYA